MLTLGVELFFLRRKWLGSAQFAAMLNALKNQAMQTVGLAEQPKQQQINTNNQSNQTVNVKKDDGIRTTPAAQQSKPAGSSSKNNGDDGTRRKLGCAYCWITCCLIGIIIMIVLALFLPLWLVGTVTFPGASVPVKLKVGLSVIVSTVGSSTGTSSLGTSACAAASYCKGWRRAGSVARAILIIAIVCFVITCILACCFCAGDSLNDCCACIPCCAPGAGMPIPKFLPCADTAAAAGPRYLTLFASLCCDCMMFILLIIAPLAYSAGVSGHKRPNPTGEKLSLSTCFYLCFVGAVFSIILGCIHTCLVVSYPALVMGEMASETGNVAGKGAKGAANGLGNMVGL